MTFMPFGVARTRELLRKKMLPLTVFIVLSAAGITLGRMQYHRARAEWIDRAYRESSQLNGIIASRLDRMESQILAVSTVFACSREVTRDEFPTIIGRLEPSGSGFSLPNLAFVQKGGDGLDQIIFSTESLRTLRPGTAFLPEPARQAMAQVGNHPSRALVSDSFDVEGVRHITVTTSARNAGGEGRLVSLIPVPSLFADFVQLSIPEGLGLVVRESATPASTVLIDTREPQSATGGKYPAQFVIRREVGMREWTFEWYLSDAYSRGPATGMGLMLITGLPILGAILAWLTDHLLRRNEDVRKRVEDGTLELAGGNVSLDKTVQELGLSRYILDKATIAIYLIDRAGKFVYVNECAAQYAGYPREELTGQHVSLLNRDSIDEQWTARWEKIHSLKPGEIDVTTMTHHRKDGTTYPIEIIAHHIRHEGKDYQLSVGFDISERERAEDELLRINARSDQALALTRAGYWSVVVGDTFYTGSPRCSEILGVEPSPDWRYSLASWTEGMEAADPGFAAATFEHYRQVCDGELPIYDVLFPSRRKVDGKVVWLHSLGKVIHAPGRPPEMYGVIQDVTENVEARRKLSEANASLEKTVHELGLYRYMLDKATTAIYLIDHAGDFIYVNECAAQYAGYSREELLGMNVRDIDTGHTPEGWVKRWEIVRALPDSELEVTRMLHRRKDGSIYPIEILAHHIRHEETDYQLSVGIDISEREQAEAELMRTNAYTDQALALTRAGYWSMIIGDTSYYSSPRCTEILGDEPTPDGMQTLTSWVEGMDAGDPELAAVSAERYRRACEGLTPNYDTLFATKRKADGRVVWVHSLGKIIKAPGRPPEMYGVVQDVTEIMETRKELEEARQAAEKANRMKSEFLANMSHEIRTPMNGVLGMAELLSRTQLEPGQREQLAMLRGSGEDLLTIINDILDFSKIEAGRLELESIGLSLHDLFGRTLQALATQAAAKKLEIELDIPGDMPDLRLGDPNRLRQVLSNLVGNSIKFTERGWVRVVVTPQGPGPHGVRVEVIDTGEGISPEAQAKLFKPFSQADASTTRKHGGTGLGLVISARIIEQMGGRIGVTSELGRGSTFWFELSLPPVAPEQVAPEVRMPDALPTLAGKRVLLVDDNAVNREVAGALMRRWGMKVSEAADGSEALAHVRAVSHPDDAGYDLAVLDGAMPGMDGWQLASAIRAIPGCGALPLVMASSSGLESAHSTGENSLFRRFLLKPLRPAQLAGALAEALIGWQPHRSAPIPEATAGARVLLVEDTKVNQMVARAMLEKGGHQVTLAGNGVEALAQLEQPELFDLILMDCQMPEMDGFEATRQLRQREKDRGWKPYRVVAMTANAMQSDRDACLEAGMDGYLAKPVRMDQLLEIVKEGGIRKNSSTS